MHGFGNLEKLEELRQYTDSIQKKELITDEEYTPEQEARLENVSIPLMEDGSYENPVKEEPEEKAPSASGSENEGPEKKQGAAGNPEKDPEEKEKEALMGGMGMGGMGIGAEFKKQGLSENFDKDVTVDENPKEEANKRTQDTMTVDKAKDMFNEMYGCSFGKQKEFDLDATKESGTVISNSPLNKIPKGW